MSRSVYLDYNATTPTDPRVVEAMLPYFTKQYGNPSSIYKLAQEAHEAKEVAREKVARILRAKPEEVVFTSGGTEADNLAVKGVAYANREKGNHIVTSQIEHHAVLNVCKWLETQGYEVTYLGVDKYGLVNLEELRKAITARTILITIMHANNEIGTIEPISKIGEIARERGIYLHTDAVQTVGKIPIVVDELGVDLLSLSAHKFHGPKGVGALYIRRGTRVAPLIHGGHHERNRRAGTENVPAIVGLGKACAIALEEGEEETRKVKALTERLRKGILDRVDDIIVNGHPEHRLHNTLNVCVEHVEGESVLLNLDMAGIAASTGSACASGSLEPSHVLSAIGVPPETARGSVRFSLGKGTTRADVDFVLEALPPIVEKLRAMSPLGKLNH